MKYPDMKYVDRYTSSTQVKFGGLDCTEGAGDGKICRMENMTSDHYPVLATREKRWRIRRLEKPGGIVALEKLGWVDGTGFYYDGILRGQVAEGEKTFGVIGTKIIILPDKCFYDTESGEFSSLESRWEGSSLTFGNGELYGEAADANMIRCEGVNWADLFREGDAVRISGCTIHPENNITPIIRGIDGDKLCFYENIFTLNGASGLTEYTETGMLRVERTVPDLKMVCETDGRLWGCDDRTIYASKPGDIFNWNVFDGLESDSWAVEPEAAGKLVGCFAYKGFAQFFKEEHIYKVYGSLPSNFQVMGSATLGIAEGSGRSLAIAGETLFWLGRNGIIAYTGGIPSSIGQVFGTRRFRNAVGGSDGMKYYVSMEEGEEGWGLYVYDTRSNLWHREDSIHVTHFARCAGQLYMLTESGEIWLMGNIQQIPEGAEEEQALFWEAEFAPFIEKSPNKKGVSKLILRLDMEEGAEAEVLIRFDSQEQWHSIRTIVCEESRRSYTLPIIPRRADHYQIRIRGRGKSRLHSMTREYYKGSEYRSTGRRN